MSGRPSRNSARAFSTTSRIASRKAGVKRRANRSSTRVPVALHHLERDVDAVLQLVHGHVLPEIGQLQGRAGGVGEPLPLRVGVAAEVQHQPAHRIGGVAAIAEQFVPIAIARHGLVLHEGVDQVRERLARNGVPFHRGPQRRRTPGEWRGPGTWRPVRRATTPAGAGSRRGRRFRRPGRRPSGSRRRRCRNPGAAAWAAGSSPRGNSRSGGWPASACRLAAFLGRIELSQAPPATGQTR